MSRGLSFIFCVAYDWRLAIDAICSVWSIADEVIVGVDANRLTWTGRPFHFPAGAFLQAVQQAVSEPIHDKLRLIQRDFYRDGCREPLLLDSDMRNDLSDAAKPGNCLLQVDSDEQLLNPQELVSWLDGAPPIQFQCYWIPVYKVVGDTAVIVRSVDARPILSPTVGTFAPRQYHRSRLGQGSYTQISPARLLHWTMGGRTREEILEKLLGWGHAGERDPERVLRIWDSVTPNNCAYVGGVEPYEVGTDHWRLVAVPLSEISLG